MPHENAAWEKELELIRGDSIMDWVIVIDNGRRLRLVYTTSPDYKPLCELNRLASYIPTCLGSKPCLLFVPSFQSTLTSKNFCSISWQLFVTVYFRIVLRIVNVIFPSPTTMSWSARPVRLRFPPRTYISALSSQASTAAFGNFTCSCFWTFCDCCALHHHPRHGQKGFQFPSFPIIFSR